MQTPTDTATVHKQEVLLAASPSNNVYWLSCDIVLQADVCLPEESVIANSRIWLNGFRLSGGALYENVLMN